MFVEQNSSLFFKTPAQNFKSCFLFSENVISPRNFCSDWNNFFWAFFQVGFFFFSFFETSQPESTRTKNVAKIQQNMQATKTQQQQEKVHSLLADALYQVYLKQWQVEASEGAPVE